jgi:hypothetical protein
MTLATVLNVAGAIMLLGAALFALLTTPRRAELARQRRTIADLLERVEGLEKQLDAERARRLAAETAATSAADRAAHVESFAIGSSALAELLERLDRFGTA